MVPSLRAALVVPVLLLAPVAAAQDPPTPPPDAPTAPPPAAPQGAPPTPAPPAPAPPPSLGSAALAAPSARPAPRPRRAPARNKRVVEVLPPPGTPIVSSPGFTPNADGTSRIWVEVSRKVEVAESKVAGRVVYRFRGAAVLQRTSQLPLITGFFATPVSRAQVVQQGPDVDLVIELREVTDVTQRVVDTPRGMTLWVDFPKPITGATAVREETTRDDTAAEPARPRATRQRRTQTLRGKPGPRQPVDEPVAPVEPN